MKCKDILLFQSVNLRKALKQVMLYCFFIICAAIIGLSLLLVSELIPQHSIEYNVEMSSRILNNEGNYRHIWEGLPGTRLDNYTDGLMLNTAYVSTGNIWYDALMNTYITYPDENPRQSLYNLFNGHEGGKISTYARYWHGYLICLRPLLTFGSISFIRSLNTISHFIIITFLMVLLFIKKQGNLCFPLLALYMSLSPIAIISSLQYSSVFYLTVLAMIVLLLGHEKIHHIHRCLIFESIGILVAFFDLLTYPAVSLGAPLILFFSLDYKKKEPWKKRILQLFSYSFSWVWGYIGMWGSKWLLASIYSQIDIFSDALTAAVLRTSNTYLGVSYTWLETLDMNYSELLSPLFQLTLQFLIIFAALRIKSFQIKVNIPCISMLLLISCFPFLWFLLFINHSALHWWMTYRELCIAVYGIISLVFIHMNFMRNESGYSEPS